MYTTISMFYFQKWREADTAGTTTLLPPSTQTIRGRIHRIPPAAQPGSLSNMTSSNSGRTVTLYYPANGAPFSPAQGVSAHLNYISLTRP